jgi:uncharacterized protein (TIGR00369 family)
MKDGNLTLARRKHVKTLLRTVPFASLIGIQLDKIDLGSARLSLNVRDELRQDGGVVHGGAIASLIDTATAFAGITVLGAKERLSTVDLTVKYLNSLKAGKAIASAKVIKAGQRLLTISADVVDEAGTPIATAISTYIRS